MRLTARQKLKILKKVLQEGEQVSSVCSEARIARKTFYQWKKKYQQAPNRIKKRALELNYASGKSHPKNKRHEFENRVISIVVLHPSWGSRKISAILCKSRQKISNHAVYSLLKDLNLETKEKREEFSSLYQTFAKIEKIYQPRPLRHTPETRKRIIEEVVIGKEPVVDVCQRYHVSRKTFYKWLTRYQKAREKEAVLLQAMRDNYVEGFAHPRSISEKVQEEILRLVRQHPEYSTHKVAQILAEVGNHGVQNVFQRQNLNTYEKRLAYAQTYRPTPVPVAGVLDRIKPLIGKIPVISAIPPPTREKIASLAHPFVFSLLSSVTLSTIFIYWLRMLSQAPTLGARLGLFFASVSLLVGSLFFAYSMKYYLTLAIVLSFSRQVGEEGIGVGLTGEIERNGGGWLARIFGLGNGNGKVQAVPTGRQAGGLQPALEHIRPKRYPFVSIHLPFYNERKVAERILKACTAMDYPHFEIVVIDDSTDETTKIVERFAKKHNKANPHGPKVKVLHRSSREGFKGGALGYALKHINPKAEFVVVFDADFIPYPDTLELFIKYFKANNQNSEDYKKSRIAVVGGYQWHVLNKSENWITRGVRTEYAGSYVIERPGREILGLLKQISGSVYMIRADVLKKIGWGTSITEDFQLTLKLYERGYKVIYTPYIQGPAECVSTLKRLIRQRMRWAEGHSNCIKKMFVKLMLSPKLTLMEKLEVLYISPYYLQAFFFLVGTLCWLMAETVFRARLPFWTSLWGWSLVLTNFFSLPLMNAVGLFLEESEEKDYLGLLSFVALSYIMVPFQAYASVKGFLEKEEGPWFRTPKTGKITDIFTRGRFYRWISGILPGRRATPAIAQAAAMNKSLNDFMNDNPLIIDSFNPYLALATANNRFDQFSISRKQTRWIGRIFLVILLIFSTTLLSLAPAAPYFIKPKQTQARGFGTVLGPNNSSQPVSLSSDFQEEETKEIFLEVREDSSFIEMANSENKEAKIKMEPYELPEGMELDYKIEKKRLKEERVLKEPVAGSPNAALTEGEGKMIFRARLELEGLEPREINGGYYFFDMENIPRLQIFKSFMVDSQGERSEEVEIEIKETGASVSLTGTLLGQTESSHEEGKDTFQQSHELDEEDSKTLNANEPETIWEKIKKNSLITLGGGLIEQVFIKIKSFLEWLLEWILDLIRPTQAANSGSYVISLTPNKDWLFDPQRAYPVIINSTFEVVINILTVYSHPQEGDDWVVSFETIGQADLTITPVDQTSIDDLEFVSLRCGNEEREPKIFDGPAPGEQDTIFYPGWECLGIGTLTHHVNKSGKHTLKFQFGDQIAYAYNDPDPGWLSGWNYRKSHVINSATGAGTNYQVKVKVHYGSGSDSGEDVYLNSKSRTDFGDVRFTDDNGTSLLESWIEEKVDSDYATFWVEVGDDLSTSNQTIYIYYDRQSSDIASLISTTHVWTGSETWTTSQKEFTNNIIDDFGSIDWQRHASNPLLSGSGGGGDWDEKQVQGPVLFDDGSEIKMYFAGVNASDVQQVGLATSSNGIDWNKYGSNPVISVGSSGAWDDAKLSSSGVIKESGTYKMWYGGNDGTTWKIGLATSSNGTSWDKDAGNPVLSPSASGWDSTHVAKNRVIKEGSTYKMWYVGYGGSPTTPQIGYATSSNGTSWNKYSGNPVLPAGSSGEWDDSAAEILHVFKIANKYVMFYEGSYDYGDPLGAQFKIGVAYSSDGISWTKHPNNPVFSWGPSGSWEDFHALHPDVLWMPNAGQFYLYYAGTDGTTWDTVAKIGVATEGPRSKGKATFLEFANFNDGTTSGFTTAYGTLDNPDDYLRSIDTGGSEHLGYKGSSRSDYAVAIKARTPSGATLREMGLLGRYNGLTGTNLETYRLRIQSTTLWDLYYRTTTDDWTLLDSGSGSYSTDTWYKLELLMEGTSIKGKIDDTQVTSVTNSKVASGYGGIRSYYNEYRHWDDFRVRKYVDPEPTHGTWGVGASTSSSATGYSFQRKTWFDGTRLWGASYSGETWYNSDWGYRKRITIDHDRVPNTNQSNFPVLINTTDADWKDTLNSGHVGQDDGGDILFTNSSGTKLDHEIEKYDETSGELVAWVEVPTVSASSDTDLFIYYGNASVDNQWDITGTWDEEESNNFKMVQHLKDLTTSTTEDSTLNNEDATKYGVNEPQQTDAKIGKGQDFDGTDDDIDTDSNVLDPNAGPFTAEMWVKADVWQGTAGMVAMQQLDGTGTGRTWFWVAKIDASTWELRTSIDGFSFPNSPYTNLQTGQWYYFALTLSGGGANSTGRIYLNGEEEESDTTCDPLASNGAMRMGKHKSPSAASEEWDGLIDEVRISNIARGANWIKTSYNNQSDPSTFYSVGGEETGTGIEFWYSSDWGASWTQNTSATLTGTNDFSIEADSSNAFIAYTDGYDIEARAASSYPGASFSWGSATTVYDGSSSTDEYDYPAMTKDSNNKVWITTVHLSSTNYIFKAIQSTNANDISAWQTASTLDTSGNSNKYGTIVPLSNGEMYATWIDDDAIEGKRYASNTVDFPGSTVDGYIYGNGGAGYPAARSTSTAFDTTSVGMWLGQTGQTFPPEPFYVYRNFLKFDTSAIGAGSTVTQVNLKLTCVGDISSTDFDVQIVKQDWSAQDPIAAGNREAAYDNCLAGTADDNIWRNTNGMSVNTQYASGNLNTAWVNKTGNTYYSLRSSRDYGNNEPSGDEYILMATQEHATAGYRPKLYIEYLAWESSATTIATGVTGMSKNMSAVASTQSSVDYVHLIYNDASSNVIYDQWDSSNENWTSFTNQTLDSAGTCEYLTLSKNTANDDLYAIWIRGDDIYYATDSSPYTSWSSATVWQTTGTNKWVTSNYSGNGMIFAQWTEGTGSPYSVMWDYIIIPEKIWMLLALGLIIPGLLRRRKRRRMTEN